MFYQKAMTCLKQPSMEWKLKECQKGIICLLAGPDRTWASLSLYDCLLMVVQLDGRLHEAKNCALKDY